MTTTDRFEIVRECAPVTDFGWTYTPYLDLDPEQGRLSETVYFVHESENAVPFDVWHGRTYRIDIAPETDAVALGEYTRTPEAAALLSRIAAGYSTYWDGHNTRGRLTDDAREALDALTDALGALAMDGVSVWEAEEWFVDGVDADWNLSPDTTDDEIEALAGRLADEAEADGQIVHGILDYLTGARDEMRDEA